MYRKGWAGAWPYRSRRAGALASRAGHPSPPSRSGGSSGVSPRDRARLRPPGRQRGAGRHRLQAAATLVTAVGPARVANSSPTGPRGWRSGGPGSTMWRSLTGPGLQEGDRVVDVRHRDQPQSRRGMLPGLVAVAARQQEYGRALPPGADDLLADAADRHHRAVLGDLAGAGDAAAAGEVPRREPVVDRQGDRDADRHVVVAAPDHQRERVAGMVASDDVLELLDAGDRPAFDADQAVAGPQLAVRRGAGAHLGDVHRARVDLVAELAQRHHRRQHLGLVHVVGVLLVDLLGA